MKLSNFRLQILFYSLRFPNFILFSSFRHPHHDHYSSYHSTFLLCHHLRSCSLSGFNLEMEDTIKMLFCNSCSSGLHAHTSSWIYRTLFSNFFWKNIFLPTLPWKVSHELLYLISNRENTSIKRGAKMLRLLTLLSKMKFIIHHLSKDSEEQYFCRWALYNDRRYEVEGQLSKRYKMKLFKARSAFSKWLCLSVTCNVSVCHTFSFCMGKPYLCF